MAKFSYEGDHPSTDTLGLSFPHGEPVEVDNPKVAAKLRNNCDFKEHGEGVSGSTKEASPAGGKGGKGGNKK